MFVVYHRRLVSFHSSNRQTSCENQINRMFTAPPLPLQTAFTSFSPWFVLTHLSDLQRFIFFFLLSGFEQIEAADYLNAIAAMWAAYTQTFISVSCPCLDLAGANKWVFKSQRWDMGLHTQQVSLCSANTWHHFWLLFCFVFAEFVVDTKYW